VSKRRKKTDNRIITEEETGAVEIDWEIQYGASIHMRGMSEEGS
jgi:hypothetical protein